MIAARQHSKTSDYGQGFQYQFPCYHILNLSSSLDIWFLMHVCGQTDRQTDMLITILCSLQGADYYILNPSNSLFSRTTWISQQQKGKPFWILMRQAMMGWQWHLLDHMQITCTALQMDNHFSTSSVTFTGQMPFLPSNQQCQSIADMGGGVVRKNKTESQ